MSGRDPRDDFQESFQNQNYNNVIKNIYASAAMPDATGGNGYPSRGNSAGTGGGHIASPPPRGPPSRGRSRDGGDHYTGPMNWRKRVNKEFVKRRSTPAQMHNHLLRMSKKMGPVHTISLPKLPQARHHAEGDNKAVNRTLRRNQISSEKAQAQSQRRSNRRHTLDIDAALNEEKTDAYNNTSRSHSARGMKRSARGPNHHHKHKKQTKSSITSPRKLKEIRSLPNHNQNQSYSILPPDPRQLYRTSRPVLDKLPLELFDDNEADLSPQQWVDLGNTKYRGQGTPARSLYYLNRQWVWTPCVVKSYEEESKNFLIEFANPPMEKHVPRLSILFNDDDEGKFFDRVERCATLREEARAIRRYTSFVDSQPSMMFSPIQQSALHGIIGKLMINSEQLVLSRQMTVEQLLMEVRDEYSRAMKKAIIDYKREDPSERAKMESLRLPEVQGKDEVAYLAVVPTPQRSVAIDNVIKTVENSHFTHYPEATLVVQALYKSWDNVKTHRFLASHEDESQGPMTLYDYQDFQQSHFNALRDKIDNDWRALVINLIRDNLNSVFKLFVNEEDEYNESELKRFLQMVTFMLRHQLCSLVDDSITDYVRAFVPFGDPRKEPLLSRWAQLLVIRNDRGKSDPQKEEEKKALNLMIQHEARIDAEEEKRLSHNNHHDNTAKLLDGYLDGPRAGLGPPGTKPMFVFKMSTSEGKVIFMPGLEAIEETVISLIDLPAKIQDIHQIDTDVVALLGIPERPLCSPETTPELFAHASEAQDLLREIVRHNLKQPRALASLYQEYGELLKINTDTYVAGWFPNNPKEGEDIEAFLERAAGHGDADNRGEQDENLTWQQKLNKKFQDLDNNDGSGNSRNSNKHSINSGGTGSVNSNSASNTGKDAEEEKPKGMTLAQTKMEIQKYLTSIDAIRNKSPNEVSFRLIKVECQMVKEQLIAKAKEVSTKLMEGLCLEVRVQNTRITAQFKEMLDRIQAHSTDVHQLAELKERTISIETREIPLLREEIVEMQKKLAVLEEFNYPITRQDFDLSWNVVRFPQRVLDTMDETKDQIEKDNDRFQKQLQHEQAIFQAEMEEYSKEVDTFVDFGVGTVGQMEQYAAKVESLQEKLDQAEKMVESFNKRDALFGDIPMEYVELTELRKKFRPYFQLWSTTQSFHANYNNWMKTFLDLDHMQISKDVNEWYKIMYNLERELKADNAVKPARVATEMKKKIFEFKENVPIIQWLTSPGLHQRHWDLISSTLAPDKAVLVPDSDLTLAQILSYDVHRHKTAIQSICTSAQAEYALEMSLEKMKKEWNDRNLELEEYRSTGTYILKKSGDILNLLDEQIMKTQAMRGSEHIEHWEKATKKWDGKLQHLSRVMEEWLKCQNTWIYLEPIFSSEDIKKKMPYQSRRFGAVDNHWRKTMAAAKKMPNLLEFVNETESLLKTFEESNKVLDVICKTLNNYLDSKRMAFPRFYFLSDAGLLSILSQTKDVTTVQAHLSKCFDSMDRLEFQKDTNLITAMYSAAGERVEFVEEIDPNEGSMKGNVEIWLSEVEKVMRRSLEYSMRRAMGEYSKTERTEWVRQHCGQCVLAVSQYYWTQQVELALENGMAGLVRYSKELSNQLSDIVDVVRGDLSHLERQTLTSLVTLDVHARDVVHNLISEQVESFDAFLWQAQLRYYWEERDEKEFRELSPRENSLSIPDGILTVKMIDTIMDYGYEYLGNTSRLVITPLTDRCYRTLMGAVSLHLGGAPEGPAGTGKTETVKDLAKAVSIHCVVFNGSDALNYRIMSKFFKGLASSGVWACFDEFNRIELDVLSVIAQQISSIQRAVVEGKNAFNFENVNIPLVRTCNVFITLNPSDGAHQGRSELPDNLKVLFRTVAMMIPNYVMIAEIKLYSLGYHDARQLARKIVSTLRLSSEQLSSQDHYDFGMRTMTAVLATAGQLKRAFPDEKEDELVLRAITDCNLPKFVPADIPLFNGIVTDLFPKIKRKDLAEAHDELLNAALVVMQESALQPTAGFETKVAELSDTVDVRHGLMIVGDTYAGKSSCIKVLADTLTTLHEEEIEHEIDPSEYRFKNVNLQYINPKALTLQQLYGVDNETTQEWTDGVLSTVMRQCHTESADAMQWLVFDGPVDALWVESMNTVLDDNKKLCLGSGETIRLTDNMRVFFEVEDLQHASPATVSRCGMVFMEPSLVGWEPLVESWFTTLPFTLDPYIDQMRDLFQWLIPPSLDFFDKHCDTVLPIIDMGLVTNFMRVYRSCLSDFDQLAIDQQKRAEEEEKKAKESTDFEDITVSEQKRQKEEEERQKEEELQAQNHTLWVESLFVFSVVWSFGVATDKEGRLKFSQFFRDLVQGHANDDVLIPTEHAHRFVRLPFPQPDVGASSASTVAVTATNPSNLFDFMFSKEENQWVHWMDTIEEYIVPENVGFHEIIVPTVSGVSLSWVMEELLKGENHVLMVGGTGTGKSIRGQSKVLSEMDKNVYVPMLLDFSAHTSANQTQDIIDKGLEKRRTGVLGPPPKKKCIVFIDDINMPQPDEYGAQAPIELLRQWMDYGGWYERKHNTFRHIVDVQFLAAMGAVGGAGNPVTSRYLRHFNLINLPSYSTEALQHIFGTILHVWLDEFPAAIRLMKDSIIGATVDIYTAAQMYLLPTPSKSHYTFNLRDVSKVFQGILSGDADALRAPDDLIRLWTHECQRVFSDRLVDRTDIDIFSDLLHDQIRHHFEREPEDLFDPENPLMYANFGDPTSAKKAYVHIDDLSALTTVVEGYLGDMNTMLENDQMNLVLFTSAIEHISRISRILRQPFGNALLVGVGGSGRQSLTRLASWIADYEVFQVEVHKNYRTADWQEDLRQILKKAGVQDKPIVFLISDTQISQESFLEDLNNILNKGEVPNLFPPEENMPIIEQLFPDARKAGKSDLPATVFQFFVERCRRNIHVVLCMNPDNPLFRKRLRMFPSLVNCTTIDWFHAWPVDALKSVAQRFISDVDLDAQVKDGVVDVCVDMQERVMLLTKEYKEATGRHNHVTPASYLELIRLFRDLFETKRSELAGAQNRYENGLRKLNETALQVKAMKNQLEALRPELLKSSKETADLIKTIEQRSVQVAQTRKIVTAEEKECNEQADAAAKIKEQCTAQLADATPALKLAMQALKVIKRPHLEELKSSKSPPTVGVMMVMEALCILMGVEPKKVGPPGAKKLDYWEPARKKLLGNPKFLVKLQKYDKENIPPSLIAKVRPYCKNPDFSPGKIATSSKAAEGFCKWVLAIEVYDHVIKQVKPKRQALAMAENSLSAAYQQLAAKKTQLKEVQDLLDDLNTQFDLVNQKKKSLEQQVKACSERLDRAEKLIEGLKVEKEHWLERATELANDYENVVGNILISSGVIAYLGVFTKPYRDECIQHWVQLLKQKAVPCNESFQLQNVLGEKVDIRTWGLQMLPKDQFSIDNAIIITKSLRWSLIIDPQDQAQRWIKNMERERSEKRSSAGGKQNKVDKSMIGLKIVKQTDDNFVRTLLNAAQYGMSVLIENVGESVDPVLEPLLTRSTFTEGAETVIRLAGEVVPYDKNFRLYLTSKLSNPVFSPELTTKVTLVNFMATPEGLQDQMLSHVVSLEKPDKEDERNRNIIKNAENKVQLQMIEDQILERLNESQNYILDDEDLINTLQKSKQACKLIEKRVALAKKSEAESDAIRAEYEPVAASASNLFFCISSLSKIDSMYQYSLRSFIELFYAAVKTVQEKEHTSDVAARVAAIDRQFTLSLYRNVCRSLFEKDKLLFSFLLYVNVNQKRDTFDVHELKFLLTGKAVGMDMSKPVPNPTVTAAASGSGNGVTGTWLPDSRWKSLCELAQLPRFLGLDDHIVSNTAVWKQYYDSANPFTFELPGYWEQLSAFQALLVLRALRPDKLITAIRSLIASCEFLGREFIQPPTFDLASSFKYSDSRSPLIFILSPGVDPKDAIYSLAVDVLGSTSKVATISLGRSQGPKAENAIREAIDAGTWVLLQNCHLYTAWLPMLERIVDEINPATTNPDFRLWLTSVPCADFPVSILQNGIKMTNEPPKGIKQNLLQSYANVNENWFSQSPKPGMLKKLYYGLAFFHANLLERRKFGSMGWNNRYEFTDSDLSISKDQLLMYTNDYDELPYNALQYLIGELNYGGRVTDEFDRRLIKYVLQDFIAERLFDDDCKFDLKGKYSLPVGDLTVDDYVSSIQSLPSVDESDVFGLHDNAHVSCAVKESTLLFDACLDLQLLEASSSSSSSSFMSAAALQAEMEQTVLAITTDIDSKLPGEFDIEYARKKFPVVYVESMNTVMVQELIRYNKLIAIVRRTCIDLQSAIRGKTTMSSELQLMMHSMYNGRLPSMWTHVGYLSCKALGAWFEDLLQRIDMFNTWLQDGPPGVFWISGFFFTQSFLTGVTQNFARCYKIPIDEIAYDFEIMPSIDTTHNHGPQDGCYIHGLHLEGARWDADTGLLAESYKRQLHCPMPVIWLRPIEKKSASIDQLIYPCPVYKTSQRSGKLSTTGRSSNFVMSINLQSAQHERHWVKRGVAMLCQLDN